MSINIGSQPLLGPLVGLTSWTLFIEGLMYSYRLPALSKYKVDSNPRKIKDEIKKIPPELEWPADNYNHLMEQPTQFYVTVLALTYLGVQDTTTVRLAWGYVALRVLHSYIQCTKNHVPTRFSVFVSSSAVLAGLTAKLGLAVFK